MKYGNDPIQLDIVEQSLMQAMSQQADTFWYLWVDSAFDVADGLKAPPIDNGINIYQAGDMSDMLPLGPRVIPVFSPGDDLSQTQSKLRPWLQHASGRPMLSVWASDHNTQTLVQHMLAWRWALTSDKVPVLLRLADTRSAYSLQKILEPEQWQALTQPLRQWLLINRKGCVASLPLGSDLSPPEQSAVIKPPIQFTEAQDLAMVQAVEPDALVHFMVTQMPEELPPDLQASTLYANTLWVCELVREHGVVHFVDKLTLLISAYATKGESLRDKANLKLLSSKSYPAGQLSEHWPAGTATL